MNEIVKKAYEILGECESEWASGIILPELEIGEVVEINDVWDGVTNIPGIDENSVPGDTGEYCYKLNDENDCINYTFEVVEQRENFLDTLVRVLEIEII